MKLAQLAIDPRAEADLRWFWTWSQGDMGLRSSFPAMVARLECGGRTGGRPIMDIDERCLEAAARARRISRALELLKARERLALCAAYGPTAPAEPLPLLGVAAPVAPMTRAAIDGHRDSNTNRPLEEWLLRLCWRVQQRTSDALASDRVLVRAIAQEADALLRQAVGAFALARTATRRTARRDR